MHHDLTPSDKVITIAELRALGMNSHAIAARCKPSGPWQRILRGVVLMTANRPTRRQRLRAAVTYGGDGAVVSGVDAMRAHGVDVPLSPDVLVLVPARRRLAGISYLTVERTTRPPKPVLMADLPYAPLARATLDAARRAANHEQLQALVSAAASRCTVAALRSELNAGSQRGSAAVRELLSDDLANAQQVVPVEVALAKRVLRAAGLPPPHWHEPIYDDTGLLLGVPDMWWPDVSLAWDVSPQTRHHDPRVWAAAGVTLVRTPLDRLHADLPTVVDELHLAFTTSAESQRRAS